MSTLYLVVAHDSPNVIEAKMSQKTEDSIKTILKEGDYIQFSILYNNNDLLYTLKPTEVYDYVCLIPNGSEVNAETPTIFKDYEETSREEKILYMPLVVLSAGETKGILNSCVWNTNIAEEVGVLTHNLARKQVDTTLYGCYIPYELFFDEENYNKEIKYYQHFYFLNKVTTNESNIVFGIPKTTLFTSVDLSFPYATNEEKLENFKKAREVNVEPS